MDAAAPYFDGHIETMPRADLERLQDARLLRVLPYAYRRSPLIRHVWDAVGVTPHDIRSLRDFRAKVPFIDKAAIQSFRDRHDDPLGGLACVGSPHLRGVGSTSGTTGDPTACPRGPLLVNDMVLKRNYWDIGARPGDYIASLNFTFRKGQASDRFADLGVVPICFDHHPRELARLCEASLRYRPRLLHLLSMPTVLGLEELFANGRYDPQDVFASYAGAIFGGEALSPRLRALIESWGLEVFENSGLGDIHSAIECRAHDGGHAWEDVALVESFDPGTGEPAGDGERGEMVVTSLMDDVAPLIRFRTEDLVTYTTARCDCGRTHGRVRTLGRMGDEIRVAGRAILPRDVRGLVEQLPETAAGLFQIVLRADEARDTLRLRVGYDVQRLATSKDELTARLAGAVSAALGIPVAVELRDNVELLKLGPPHKIPRVTKH